MDLKGKKILVAYFSRSGNNYFQGHIVSLRVGNTATVAKEFQKQTGGDLFQIIPVKDYSLDYRTCTEEAQTEQQQQARPALKEHFDASSYDIIFLGSPNWWGSLAMPVFTFIEENKRLEGKTVVPFITHEGSQMGNVIRDLKKECPKASVLNGLAIQGSYVMDSPKIVSSFLKTI
jgi:flavodoxin